MLDGATGESSSNSGSILYHQHQFNICLQIHYNAVPGIFENNDTNYISMNFPNGLLYCCLAEAYGF